MARLSKEQWAEVRSETVRAYIEAKDKLRRVPLFTVSEESENPLATDKLFESKMKGFVGFDSSRLAKTYNLPPAEWSFSLSEQLLGAGAHYIIKGPGHHEIEVTKCFMDQINSAFAEACEEAGFNKLINKIKKVGEQNEQFEIWSTAFYIYALAHK